MLNLLSLLPSNNVVSAVFEKISKTGAVAWTSLFTVSVKHNIGAIVWDDIQQVLQDANTLGDGQFSKPLKLKWGLHVQQVESGYARQRAVIAKLAKFFGEHGIKMMILKGYGLSLNYPVPNHRPCGDIDIWLFEERQEADGSMVRVVAQERADALLKEHYGVDVDDSKHHHTVFYIDGVMIENHYDFLNIHSHRSNRDIERRLQQLAQQDMEEVSVDNSIVYLPSPDFHALFLLRHSAAHFAAAHISLRHILDWHYFVMRYGAEIDWTSLYAYAREMNMHRFLSCMNAICVDYFSLEQGLLPVFERDAKLEKRVWNEILQPEFSLPAPKNAGYLRSWVWKFRRWWANRWKRRFIYREGLVETFFVQVYSHLLKPRSLK